jgi:catechol 2,3-dioxygenase-like lactoylglutathione lyase family enzyme
MLANNSVVNDCGRTGPTGLLSAAGVANSRCLHRYYTESNQKPLRRTMISIKITTIYVNDQAQAIEFYTNVLGFQKILDFPAGQYRFLTIASAQDPHGTQLSLEPNDNPIAQTYQAALYQAGLPGIVFGVDDIQQQYQRMSQLGVQFRQPPTAMGSFTVAVLDDTCGNFIQLLQA